MTTYTRDDIARSRRDGRLLIDRLWQGGNVGCYQTKQKSDWSDDSWSRAEWVAVGKRDIFFEPKDIYFSVNPLRAVPPMNKRGGTDPRFIGPQVTA